MGGLEIGRPECKVIYGGLEPTECVSILRRTCLGLGRACHESTYQPNLRYLFRASLSLEL